MGEVELNIAERTLIIHSHIITYGEATTPELTEQLREEIQTMWNEPGATLTVFHQSFRIQFSITAACRPSIEEVEVLGNTDPRNNYFRIEEYVEGNISFVDGLGCNTGFFKLENLYKGSTTAAHEYGHTSGLDHPDTIDIRGTGVPGIMYPRGTLVDAAYQYDPAKPAGVTGGTMHPMHRKVFRKDIADLRLDKLRFTNGRAILGGFTNIYHWPHLPTAAS